ncbi:MAG: TetR/AcrR family transcriptional regulator [Chitinophagales bacterium]|nr:TetR/AcrR family transcriptional regulator [Chitinophagales bacterium]
MDRKTEIIEAAARIIGSDGVQAFTTKRLAAMIGISEAALYRYYSGKDEIIHKVFEHFEGLIGQKIASIVVAEINEKEKIETIFEIHKHIFEDYPELVFLLFSEGSFIDIAGLSQKISEILTRKFSLMESLIQQGQTNGTIRNDIAAYELGKVLMGYFRMYLLQLRLEGNMNNLDKYCKDFFKTINKLI